MWALCVWLYLCLGAAWLTCCVEWAFVHMMHPLVQQTEGLLHIVCRSHSWACYTTRLLQETKSIVRTDHLLADSSKTPGREKNHTVEHFKSWSTLWSFWRFCNFTELLSWMACMPNNYLFSEHLCWIDLKAKPKWTHSSLEYLYASSTIFFASSKQRRRRGLPRYSTSKKQHTRQIVRHLWQNYFKLDQSCNTDKFRYKKVLEVCPQSKKKKLPTWWFGVSRHQADAQHKKDREKHL